MRIIPVVILYRIMCAMCNVFECGKPRCWQLCGWAEKEKNLIYSIQVFLFFVQHFLSLLFSYIIASLLHVHLISSCFHLLSFFLVWFAAGRPAPALCFEVHIWIICFWEPYALFPSTSTSAGESNCNAAADLVLNTSLLLRIRSSLAACSTQYAFTFALSFVCGILGRSGAGVYH